MGTSDHGLVTPTTKRRGSFLIVTWDGGGNVPPAIALGARLVRAGHRVRLLGPATVADAATGSGIEWVPYRSIPPWPEGLAHEDDWDGLMTILNGRPMIDDLVAAVREEEPDALVVDCLMGAALAVGESLGLPTAVLIHVLYQPFVQDWGHQVVDVVRPRIALGLEPVDASSVRGVLGKAQRVLALTPPGFDFPIAELPANTSYVGPIVLPDPPPTGAEIPWLAGDDESRVLISFSTTVAGQREALPPILDAMARLPVRGLLTLGGVPTLGSIPAPSNVDVFDYVPHAAVLPHVSAVVCHGGLSTVMSALAYGVPLVCIPQGREQPLNAERVQACGVGVTVPADAPGSTVAAAVGAVLEDPSYREAAGRFAALIADAGAGGDASRSVEALLRSTSVPV